MKVDYSDPRWAAIRDKRMSDLTQAQQQDAHELWLREQLESMPAYHQEHYLFLLARIDEARRASTVDCSHTAAYWQGHDVAIAGVAERWQQALTSPIPAPGVMSEPLESLYRRTEALRFAAGEPCTHAWNVLGRCTRCGAHLSTGMNA